MNAPLPILERARLFTRDRFPIIPTKSKIPVLDKWVDRRKQVATDQELVSWFSNGEADSIAIIINNTEFAVDTDGDCEQVFLQKLLPLCSPELREKINKTMYTKTPNGYHRTFRISNEDFPAGIPEKTYLTINGKYHKHDEIALKGRNHYLVEYGPGYITLNGIDCLVTLAKEEVNELLDRLEEISPNKNTCRGGRPSQGQQQEKQSQLSTSSAAYHLDDIKVSAIVKELEQWYKIGSRDEIIFSCCGCLHKWEVSEESAIKVVTHLALNDEERESRIQTVKNTYAKKRDSSEVSGRNRFVDALSLITNDRIKAEDIVVKIGEIVTQALKEKSSESEFEHVAKKDSYDGDLKGISPDILTSLNPHVYSVVSFSLPVMYVAHKSRRQIIKAIITFPHETTEDISSQNQDETTRKQRLHWKQKLILAILLILWQMTLRR